MAKRGINQAIFIALLLIGVVGTAERASGQFFICSGGPNDGGPCASDDDCTPAGGGACVVIQGVCQGGGTDGFPCDCPSGVCDANPVCSADASLGTCRGGAFNAECCDYVNFNCEDNAPCVGSQKICCSGSDKGFSCLNNSQCTGGGSCVSTGKFCLGGDFDSYTCCDNSDCGSGGECVTPFVEDEPTPTPTQVRTATPTVPGVPTHTRTPIGPTPTGTIRTPTRTVPPTHTIPSGVVLAQTISNNETTIIVSNGGLLPVSGTVLVDAERIRFAGRTGNTLLGVTRGVDGTAPASHSAGAAVTLVETPPPTATVPSGPSIIDYSSTAEGACAVTTTPSASPFWWATLLVVGFVKVRGRRR